MRIIRDRYRFRSSGSGGIKRWRHETEDEVQGESTEDGDAVDVAVEDFSGEEEEGAVEDYVEDSAIEVAVVHEVLVDAREGV